MHASPNSNRSFSLLRFAWVPLALLASCVAPTTGASSATTLVAIDAAAPLEDVKNIKITPDETGFVVTADINTENPQIITMGPGENETIVIPGGAMIAGSMSWTYGPSGDVHIGFPAGTTTWFNGSGNTVSATDDILVKLSGWTGSAIQVDVFEGTSTPAEHTFTKTATSTTDAAQVLLIPRSATTWNMQVTNQYKRVEILVGHP